MSDKMTFEAAVEIVANGIPRLLLAEVPIAERIERRYMRARAIVDQGTLVIKAIRNVMASDTIDCNKAADFVRYRADQEIRKLMEMEKGYDGPPVSSV